MKRADRVSRARVFRARISWATGPPDKGKAGGACFSPFPGARATRAMSESMTGCQTWARPTGALVKRRHPTAGWLAGERAGARAGAVASLLTAGARQGPEARRRPGDAPYPTSLLAAAAGTDEGSGAIEMVQFLGCAPPRDRILGKCRPGSSRLGRQMGRPIRDSDSPSAPGRAPRVRGTSPKMPNSQQAPWPRRAQCRSAQRLPVERMDVGPACLLHATIAGRRRVQSGRKPVRVRVHAHGGLAQIGP